MGFFLLPLHEFLRFAERVCDPLYHSWVWALRDFTHEPYSESPGQVCLNSALVVMPFARVYSSDLQSWSVTPVIRKCHLVLECYSPLPHPMATTFGSIGAESNVDLCPIGLVSGGKSSVKVTAASTVRDSALFLLKPSISS